MIYAVGDIHGHLGRLVRLLAKLPLTEEDQLVFVGDYIDRGPESAGVIDCLIELAAARPNTVFLRGNHEQMMLESRDAWNDHSPRVGELFARWAGNGGDTTLDSYPRNPRWVDRIPAGHWHFLESTLLEFETEAFHFVHAGLLPPGAKWPYAEDPRLWVREEFLNSRYDFGKIVVFGHTPQRSGHPLVEANKIGIDTAAAFGGPLTAVGLGGGALVFYQV